MSDDLGRLAEELEAKTTVLLAKADQIHAANREQVKYLEAKLERLRRHRRRWWR